MFEKKTADKATRELKIDPKNNPADFKLIYESRDKGICAFEDQKGHISVVRSSRLA